VLSKQAVQGIQEDTIWDSPRSKASIT